MFKRAIGLVKLVVAVILISTITLWTTGMIVTHYLDSLLKQYNIPFDTKPAVVSGFWGKMWGASPPVQEESEQKPEDATPVFGQVQDDIGVGEDNTESLQTEVDGNQNGTSDVDEVDTHDDLDTLINGNSGGLDVDGVGTAMTSEDIASVKDNMKVEDKEQLFAMLVGKLPEETWKQLSEIVEDGVTEEELTMIQQLMAMHLNKEEYEEMMEILKKY